MYKIIYGVPAMFLPKSDKINVNEKGHIYNTCFDDEDDPWFDFALEYHPAGNYYCLGFETMLGFKDKDGCVKWIKECYNLVCEYLKFTPEPLDMYKVFTEGVDINTKFETVQDALSFLRFCVNGFEGNGLFVSEENYE